MGLCSLQPKLSAQGSQRAGMKLEVTAASGSPGQSRFLVAILVRERALPSIIGHAGRERVAHNTRPRFASIDGMERMRRIVRALLCWGANAAKE
jgi:hypothetical protein